MGGRGGGLTYMLMEAELRSCGSLRERGGWDHLVSCTLSEISSGVLFLGLIFFLLEGLNSIELLPLPSLISL